jgi:hypothetical protein
MNQKFPHVKVRLFTQDNPLAILGRTIKAMRSAGVRQDEIDIQQSSKRELPCACEGTSPHES